MVLLQAVKVLLLSSFAFLAAFAITPAVRTLLIKYGVRKQIRASDAAPIYSALHQKKEGTPTMGGAIIWFSVIGLAFLIALLANLFDGFWGYLNFVSRAETYLPLAAMALAAGVGFLDDLLGVRRIGAHGGGLRVSRKLILYVAIAALGALWFYFRLDWDVLYIPLWGNVVIGWWYAPFFIFVVAATAFSANEADGLDGLLGGVMLFAYLAMTVVAFALGRFELATLSGVISGAILAFLWFNIYPAQFFMGDTGSMALGITLGVIAMLTNTALFLPFFASILVLESYSVIVQLLSKKIRGKKIFLSTPIHHHFEALGWPESKVTMRFWIISAAIAMAGLAIFFLSRYL